MQLQQLRYLIAAAEEGSFRAAASRLYVSQSSISVAIKDLEQETGVEVFRRTSRGTTLTSEGAELVGYARGVIEQLESMEARYSRATRGQEMRLAISSQHYSLVVDAFGDFVNERSDERCEFTLLESYTNQIIRDVAEGRSALGILYRSNYNDQVMARALSSAGLSFIPLFSVRPHIVVRADHAFAHKDSVLLDELEGLYRFEQEQGIEGSSFFSEEPLSFVARPRRLVVSDNGSLASLIARTDGYAVGTGVFLDEADGLVSVPIDTDETMTVGAVRLDPAPTDDLADAFLRLLASRIVALGDRIEVLPAALDLAQGSTEQ